MASRCGDPMVILAALGDGHGRRLTDTLDWHYGTGQEMRSPHVV